MKDDLSVFRFEGDDIDWVVAKDEQQAVEILMACFGVDEEEVRSSARKIVCMDDYDQLRITDDLYNNSSSYTEKTCKEWTERGVGFLASTSF